MDFSKVYQLKGLELKNKGHMNFYECCDLTKKYIYHQFFIFFCIGNYSCLVAKFHLSRSIGFHMVQSYIPTMLIVIISWVSFWMDTDSVPGRTTLGVTTLLTVSSKSAGKF